ncbi:MAG: nuclear transport factor 2 family protein [Dehalococcoidales bacterium]|nr:nuclear transport factor 2 family protein [Dehalococcoidales bacterium]
MAIKDLEARVKALEKKVTRLEDINKITRLQRVYSYYVMHMMRDEIYDCFADRDDVKLRWLEGTWYGKKGVARYFGVGDKKRPDPPPGFIHQVMPIAGVVDVAPDGKTAKGRWYSFGGVATPDQKTGKTNPGIVGGIYEIDYIKEKGTWKFWKIDWIIPLSIKIPSEYWSPAENLGRMLAEFKAFEADEPFIQGDPRFVSGYIFPFHYDHPVTGKPTSEGKKNAALLKNIKGAEKAVRDMFGLDDKKTKKTTKKSVKKSKR